MTKITILPPQKAPKQLTAHRGAPSLGEHCLAFLNANNRHGFLMDEPPEEPVEEIMAMLFLSILQYVAQYKLLPGVRCEKIKEPKRVMAARAKATYDNYVAKMEIERAARAIAEIEFAKEMASRPLVMAPATDNAFRKHLVATRTHFSFQAVALNNQLLSDAEYLSRRDTLGLGTPLEQYEKMRREFKGTYNLMGELDPYGNAPKSNPTGSGRTNPFL